MSCSALEKVGVGTCSSEEQTQCASLSALASLPDHLDGSPQQAATQELQGMLGQRVMRVVAAFSSIRVGGGVLHTPSAKLVPAQ